MLLPLLDSQSLAEASEQQTKKPLTYTAGQLISGVIQIALAHAGVVLVRTVSANSDRLIPCYTPNSGGIFGSGTVNTPIPGTPVTVTINPNTGQGSVIAYHHSGKEQPSYIDFSYLHCFDWVCGMSTLKFIQQLNQTVSKEANSNMFSSPCGALQDTYAGDTLIGDRYGPFAFFGRTQLTIKGSGLAYTQYSAAHNAITTVAQSIQTSTLSSDQQLDTEIHRKYWASGAKQGLGIQACKDEKPIEDAGSAVPKLKYTDTAKAPIYREQEFHGGLPRGSHCNIIYPLKDQNQNQKDFSVFASSTTSYTGATTKSSVDKLRSIKTPFINGLQAVSDSTSTSLNLERIDFCTPDPSNRSLQIDKILQQEGTHYFLRQQLSDQDIMNLYRTGVSAVGKSLGQRNIQWTQTASVSTQELDPSQYAEINDSYTGQKKRVYKNTSFITQQDDGSILIKDGWGSEIRMTGGNIFISSALDTFIRPGRDMIGLVPRRMQLDANGAAVVAAKKSLKLASEGDTVLSSGISGQDGFTVIQNRSKTSNAGVVIRSNGNTSITASRDMFIGLNDKVNKNAGNSTSKGTGTVVIDAGTLILNANYNMKATSAAIGIYSYAGSSGGGLTLSGTSCSVQASNVMLGTASFYVGGFSNDASISKGDSNQTFNIVSGSGSCVAHIRGQLQTKDITAGGTAIISGQLVAGNFAAISTHPVDIIPGLKPQSISTLRKQIANMFSSQVKGAVLNIAKKLQTWYNDNFICNHELKFTDSDVLGFSGEYKMPKMCWQINTVYDQTLQPISVSKTGEAQNMSYAYPGKTAWDSGFIASIDNDNNIKYTQNIQTGYKVNTDKEDM